MFHPAKEVKVVPETLVVVVYKVLVTVTILVTEEASVIMMPLVAAMVVEYFVAVGMSIMDGIDGNSFGDVRRYSDFGN